MVRGIGKGMLCIVGTQYPRYMMEGNDHEPILDYYKLVDESLHFQKVVRVKLLPKGHLFSTNVADWEFWVNDPHFAPSWFTEEESLWHTRCVDALVDKIIPIWKKEGIMGFLDLSNTKIEILPDGLKIKAWKKILPNGEVINMPGHLNLMGTKLTKLPRGLEVEGNLRITSTWISEIPKDIKVTGEIHR